ncbi:non-specific lipid transfer protein GPI-anchored 26-like isoform X2 [Vicia villosa]|uniref:non-specific lipid transfer protein GPI-anchored 26-like isoform X2 n=1 Tax=Vicia villosa TaxID=3911 RepID=UPI00273B30B2|nr:non-specific lipid transfer protein GPI-anchored 26-like isoform X2 [Vicia villosa]
MAFRSNEMLLVLSMFFVLVSLWGVTVAQQTDSSCTNVFISLSPCLDYITEQTSTPSSACCSQLASVMGSQPQCLCEVVNGGAASSIAASFNINQTRALALPTACNIQTPPINTCNGISISNIPNSPSGSFSSTTGTTGSIRGSSSSYRTSSSSGKLQCSLLVLVIFAKFTFIFMTTT